MTAVQNSLKKAILKSELWALLGGAPGAKNSAQGKPPMKGHFGIFNSNLKKKFCFDLLKFLADRLLNCVLARRFAPRSNNNLKFVVTWSFAHGTKLLN